MTSREEMTAQDMQALKNELAQLQKEFSTMAGKWKDLAGEVGADTYEGMRAAAGRVRTRAAAVAEDVTDTIEHRPLLSIVTAFVIGLLLGVLFGRQR